MSTPRPYRHKFPRSPELVARITAMRDAGNSWCKIGRVLGCNESTAKIIGTDAGLPASGVAEPANAPKPLDAKMCEMWTEGLTANEIARRLHVTRNVVIGRVHRLGLAGRPSPMVDAKAPPQLARSVTGYSVLPSGHPETWGAISNQPWPGLKAA